MQAGTVTDEGLHFATLSASKTAASILTKTVEHHQFEAQQEADVAEGVQYRDSIKADIKAWAFQVHRFCTTNCIHALHDFILTQLIPSLRSHEFIATTGCLWVSGLGLVGTLLSSRFVQAHCIESDTEQGFIRCS